MFYTNELLIRPIFIAALAIISLFLISIVAFALFSFVLTAIIIYTKTFVRTNPNKWSRDVPSSADKNQKKMYEDGIEFMKDYLDRIEEVHIESEGFNLYGQFFNNNSKKTVIIIPGRTEGALYSYFYAKPYIEEGFNALFIDNRAHGLSDGRYNCVGLKEYKDIQNWAKFLEEKYNTETVVLHGICIGAATSVYAKTFEGAPNVIKGLVTEGMYITFYETFKNHLVELRKPIFPFADLVMLLFRLNSSIRPKKQGPIYCMDKVTCPILMLQSNADIYSYPDKAEDLYVKCASRDKEIVYFEDAPHSMIRLYHKDGYDLVIKQFLRKYFK